MRKCIMKMKSQTCWRLLKHHGYDSNLNLKQALWDDKTIAMKDIQSARNFEIRPRGLIYLRKLFNSYCKKVNVGSVRKAYLDKQGVEKIFQPCPP